MKYQFKHIIQLVLLMLLVTPMSGQDSTSVLVVESPQTELIDARDKIDYSKDIIEKEEKEEEEEKKKNRTSPNFNFSDVAGILLIVSLIGVVFLILYFMLGKENMFRPKSTKIKELNLKSIEQIEENLEDHDVAYYLKQAVSDQQYRIAIRLHYLLIIKELSEKKFIKWKRDKTNRNYLMETESFAFSSNFKRSTSIFEKVWYGERSVDEEAFNMIQSQFNSLYEEINRQTA